MDVGIRREVSTAFRLNGFTLKKEAIDFCSEVLSDCEKARRTKLVDRMIAALRKQTLDSPFVTADVLRDVLTLISNAGQEQTKLFNVFDAFYLKKFNFDSDCKKLSQSTESRQVISNVSKATAAFRHRFQLVLQRARRCKKLEHIRFYTVDSLLGSTKRIENVVLIGLLTQQKADCYHLEDLTGSLQLDFSGASFKPGIFIEGGIYMFEGVFDAGLLNLNVAALVPLETSVETRNFFGNENYFGGNDTIAFGANKKLSLAVNSNPEASIVILSDVHLDKPEVLRALYHMWSGFSAFPPIAFIICGNFCSKTRRPETSQLLDDGFRRLSNQLNDENFRSQFKNTSFVFVPGPDDPALNLVLPRPHLPSTFFNHLRMVPNVFFSTNPVRIQYGSKEIVVLRDDLVEKICRHTVNQVSQNDIPRQFSRTVLSQAHLSPLPTHIAPVLWEFDHALTLHPLPDLLIVADKFQAFSESVADCIVSNPGSFSSGSFGFHVYYPQQGKVEDSLIEL